MVEIIVPVALFATIGTVFFSWFYFRYRTRAALQNTLQAALEQGQQLTPDLIEQLGASVAVRANDLRRGILSLAFGAALILFGSLLGEEDARSALTALSAFPILLGLAFLGLHFFVRGDVRGDRG